ncbi:MAG TPA: Mur ligase family protein [Candidatus Paceibacterota bacterium]
MKKIAIMGFGVEGRATFEFLKNSGGFGDDEIYVFDDDPDIQVPEGAVFHFGHIIPGDFDVVYKTPGMHPAKMVLESPKTKVTSLTNLFMANVKGKVIGVTGSKGKSTTASLIHHILLGAGKKSVLVGNIGTAALLKLSDDSLDTWYVYEMSSYQCELLYKSPHISVITNLHQEHLDHHGTLENYWNAKKKITEFQSEDDFLITPDNLDIETKANKVKVQSPAVKYETKLLGDHNQLNIAMAITAVKCVGVSEEEAKEAVKSFEPLEYRLEKVGEFKGITFYDDSLATIPEATLFALSALPDVDTLILGGQDRGISLTGFPEALSKSQVETFITLPENGPRMVEGITGKSIFHANSMEEAVGLAYANAKKAVLLSNASPSYNMFKDYKDKSAQYRHWIKFLV